jgi:DNA-directed RNA polymerase subunit M/transcription elongation factor TFIIS
MNSIREKVVSLISDKELLNEFDVKDLEKGIYNWCLSYSDEKGIIKNWSNPVFKQLYCDKSRSIIANIDKKSYIANQRLLTRLNENEFKPHDIPFMKPNTMFPEVWRELVELKFKRDEKLGEMTLQPMTDQFKCAKCKNRNIVYYEKQLRSADEPSTVFLVCLNCSHSWKM